MLGPIEVRVDGAPRPFGAGRDRFVLATLLLGAGRTTTSARLIDALWDDPPRTAKAQLHNIISRLRRTIGRTDLILTHATGYELRLTGGDTLDAAEFRGLAAEGRHALAAGDPAGAAALFDTALGLWRGPALAGLPDELAAATRNGLHEERLAAREARLDAWLALGRHTDMLTELTALLAEHPYRENLHQARMLAYAGAGLRADALATYRQAHRTLADGLGIAPGPALRSLEQRIARGEDVTPRPARVVARQLPPPAAILTGRDELVAEVRAALGGPAPCLLVGPGGVGKTAVALAAGGTDVFTGGQLFADLRGTQETPADPHVVVGRFLHALGVRQAALPKDRDERVALYRGLLAGSRTLVVLDDAASEEQVRPLLPADPGCAALVTSRHQLAALTGAHRWTVPVLDPAAAVDLLGRIAGPDRVAAEPGAAAELAAVCGRFPLAVSIAAARLAVRPDWTLAEFAGRLSRERDRLDELAVGDLDVRASIAAGYATLSAAAARLLRLLGLVTAPDWPAWVPSALLDGPARKPLDELVDVHLVAPPRRDAAGQERFRLHDLVADFAREKAEDEDGEPAVVRVLSGWLALAAHADRQVPHGETFAPPAGSEAPPVPVTRPYEWFDAERASLSTAVGDAVRIGRADLAGRLALHMSGYLELRCFYEDWLGALQTAIPPVRAAGHDELLVRLLGATFAAYSLADRFAELPAVAEEELAVARGLGDRAAEVTALVHTGRAARDLGRYGQAGRRLAAAVALAEQAGGRALVDALAADAVLRLKAGDPARAVELLDRVRVLDDDPGHTARGVLYRYLTGLALTDLDRLDEARVVLAEGRAVCAAIEDDVGLVYLGWAAANVDIAVGAWQPAADALAGALRGAEKLGATDAVAEVLRSLGDLAAAQGRGEAAMDTLHRSLAIWRGLDAPVQTARTLARLEHVARALGDDATATACHREWRGLLAELELDERCLRLPRFLRARRTLARPCSPAGAAPCGARR